MLSNVGTHTTRRFMKQPSDLSLEEFAWLMMGRTTRPRLSHMKEAAAYDSKATMLALMAREPHDSEQHDVLR